MTARKMPNSLALCCTFNVLCIGPLCEYNEPRSDSVQSTIEPLKFDHEFEGAKLKLKWNKMNDEEGVTYVTSNRLLPDGEEHVNMCSLLTTVTITVYPNSLYSIQVEAFDRDGKKIGSYSAKIETPMFKKLRFFCQFDNGALFMRWNKITEREDVQYLITRLLRGENPLEIKATSSQLTQYVPVEPCRKHLLFLKCVTLDGKCLGECRREIEPPESLDVDLRFAHKKVKEMEVKYDLVEGRLEMSWEKISESEDVRYVITSWVLPNGVPYRIENDWSKTNAYMKLFPNLNYKIKVECLTPTNHILAHSLQFLKTVFTEKEQSELYGKAVKYVDSGKMETVTTLDRCGPEEYWDEMYRSSESKGMIKPKKKDNGGQRANRINGEVHGIFFYARNGTKRLPRASAFGNTRFTIDVQKLIDPTLHRLYFADFYCMGNTTNVHYVTLVCLQKRNFNVSILP